MTQPSDAMFRYFRRAAKDLDSLGDSVGPNDMELSNLLWYASVKVEEYANRFKEGENNDA